MPELTVAPLDVSILMIYVLGSRLVFGWYIARKRRMTDSEAYFLGGRNIHWVLIDLSFYVSNMSGSTFVGLPGSGYLNGLMTVICSLIFVTTSFMGAKPSPDRVAAITWSGNHWRSESRQLATVAWYRNYRYLSILLLAAALVIVAVWW